MTESLFHYSKLVHLNSIIESGFIKPATVGLYPGEKPAVWLTTDNRWEGTALPPQKQVMSYPLRTVLLPIRFQVKTECLIDGDVVICTWDEHKATGGINSIIAIGLEKAAVECDSNPSCWRCSYHNIPIKCFHEPEVFNGVNWVPVDFLSEILSPEYEIPRDNAKPKMTARQKKKLVSRAKKSR